MKTILVLSVVFAIPTASAQLCDDEAKRTADSLGYTVNLLYSKTGYYDFDFVIFNFQCFNNSTVGLRGYVDFDRRIMYSEGGGDSNSLHIVIEDDCKYLSEEYERECHVENIDSGSYKIIGKLSMDHAGPGDALGQLLISKITR